MKKRYFALVVLMMFTVVSASAQLMRTSYFMEESRQRTYFNPSFRPSMGYVDIPVLGNFALNYNSTMAFNDVFYPVDGQLVSFLDKNVTADELLPRLQNMNSVSLDIHAPILSAGFYTGKSFWSIELSAKADVGFKLPKEMFEFVKIGSGEYDIKNLSVGASGYANLALGFSRECFIDDLILGARINFKMGLMHANIHYDRLYLKLMMNDTWRAEAHGNLALTGFDIPDTYDEDSGDPYMDLDNINFNMRGLSGFGMSLDLGASYKVLDMIKVSAAVSDLGFMSWNENKVTRGRSESEYHFSAIDIDDGGGIDYDASFDFNSLLRFERQPAAKVKDKVYATVTLGAELDIFGNDLLGVGVVYMYKNTEFSKRSEFSATLTCRPTDWFTAAISYGFLNYRNVGPNGLSSLGWALNFHPRWINFFIGSDFIFTRVGKQFIPLDQKKMNFHIGISVPLAGNRLTQGRFL